MPGWKRHSRTVSSVLALIAGAAAQAADPPPGQPIPAQSALPEAFLEFLGEWSDQQGNWQDPLEFDDPRWQLLDNDAERHDEID